MSFSDGQRPGAVGLAVRLPSKQQETTDFCTPSMAGTESALLLAGLKSFSAGFIH
ncbi:MAG: hypothetical protein K2Q97_16120 [Burkholderiaceae bacterium]|nr:hypothetical protein [Burkholderiaceae bacterium]